MGKHKKQIVGNVEIHCLQDTWMKLPPTEVFPETDWSAFGEFLDNEGRITMNSACWLLRSQGQTMLVDTGFGGRSTDFPILDKPSLPSILEELSVKPTEIDLVLFTHLHFDHTGWNTVDENGAAIPLFSNARHVMQKLDWDFWIRDENLELGQAPTNLLPVESAGLVDLVDGEYAINSEIVTVPLPGHTPGHVGFAISSGGEKAYILGDAAHHPAQVTMTSWPCGFDVNSSDSNKSRNQIIDRIEREGALMAVNHFPHPGFGHAKREGGIRRFVPIAE
jgi:glyoxylase-like metal-dependent hydrolase (beta-lactamase superfamily II)